MEIEVAAELPLLEPLPLGVKAEEELAAAAPQPEAAPPAGPLDDLQALLAGETPSWLPAPQQQEQAEEQAGQQQQQQQQQQQAGDAEMADAEAADGLAASEAAAAAPSEGGDGAAAPSDAAAAEDGPPGEDDALAADLLSNMAAWQSELDTFTAALKRCMETQAKPNEGAGRASPSVDGSGLGSARLQHSGPKGVTGFRGVTQHKRTKRYEANVWMDHKQMYLGAFDAPEQAAHAHDIGALCSGKARPESLNFPLSDYELLLPLLASLPHAQIVAALRSYGRLPTARPAGGVSSGRLLASPAARSASVRSGRGKGAASDTDEDEEGAPLERAPRPRRQRKLSSKSLGDSPVPSRLGAASPIDWQAALAAREDLGSTAAVPGLPPPPAVAAAQQAQLQALSAALLGAPRAPSALSGAAGEVKDEPLEQGAAAAAAAGAGKPPGLPLPPPPAAHGNPQAALLLGSMGGLPLVPAMPTAMPTGMVSFGGVSPLGAFEVALGKVMARSHELDRPEGEGVAPRPLHSGPKGQSGFKGVTLYKRCQRYNAHIWLGKQTHIGTFHTAEQAAVAHDVMELWRNESAQGLNFASPAYTDLLPLLKSLSEADALSALRTYSRSPAAAAAAAASGAATGRAPGRPNTPASRPSAGPSGGGRSAREPREPREQREQPAVQPPAPSLRRRSRKPQHVALADKSEDSSGGSVPPPPAANTRQSAGSLMWYMLEQEKSADDDFSGEQEDPDFSPADDLAAQQTSRARRGGSESPSYEPLGFHPRVTPSVAAALVADIPADQAIVGARPPRPGSSHRWGVAVSLRGQAAWFGRLDRQRAAVAADLSLAWRRMTNAVETGEPLEERDAAIYNVSSANYDQDSALMDQLRRIRTAPQLCQFLAAVIPQDPPAAPGTAAAAAAASALPASRLAAANNPLAAAAALAAAAEVAPVGARKRKLNSLLEETQAAKLVRMASTNSGSASPRPPLPPAPAAAPASVPHSGSSTPADATPAAPPTLPVAASGTGPQPVGPAAPAQQQQQQQQPTDGLLSAAAAAVAAADTSDPGSMLSALRLLVDAGQGGSLLKEVVASWGNYSELVQADLFTALQMPVAGGDWDQLEGRLQVALDLASLF